MPTGSIFGMVAEDRNVVTRMPFGGIDQIRPVCYFVFFSVDIDLSLCRTFTPPLSDARRLMR